MITIINWRRHSSSSVESDEINTHPGRIADAFRNFAQIEEALAGRDPELDRSDCVDSRLLRLIGSSEKTVGIVGPVDQIARDFRAK
jgi:hypothetical protein